MSRNEVHAPKRGYAFNNTSSAKCRAREVLEAAARSCPTWAGRKVLRDAQRRFRL